MSAAFSVDWEWHDSPSAAVRSHGLTWSRLVIRGEGRAVTTVNDLRARSVREGIFLPLMPLAEWLAANWWFLFEESPPIDLKSFSPRESDGRHRAWFQRHNLLAAREGFSLPDLTIASGDDVATLSLRADDRVYANAPVRFIEGAQWLVSRDELKDPLSQLVSAVVGRLEGCDDADARALRELWQRRSTDAAEELLLAQRAAALGLDGDDPAEVSDELAESLLALGDGVPEPLLREALALRGDEKTLARQVESIRDARGVGSKNGGDVARLARDKTRSGENEVLPFRQGWALARRFRESVLQVEPGVVGASLDKAIAASSLLEETSTPFTAGGGLHGWVDASAEGRALCALGPSPSAAASRFLRARALGSVLLGRRERLVTDAATRSQRIAHAFAAELLAPAEALRRMLSGEVVSDREVGAIAKKLDVSQTLVRHQIENRDLATVGWG